MSRYDTIDEIDDQYQRQIKQLTDERYALRAALELVMRHVALALPKEVCALANKALTSIKP